MKYKEALNIANIIKILLSSYCNRIEIAGSIRRKKQEVKDIELVAIPYDRFQIGLIVNKWKKIRGNVDGKYLQRTLPEGINLDLFFANKDNWGAILLIRTGDWEFSKKFMGSVMPKNNYKQKDGYVWKDNKIVPVYEEEDLFKLMNIPFIEPEFRDKNAII